MIAETMWQPLNDQTLHPGHFVLYWMQAAQRAQSNPALEYASARANELGVPLLAVFGLTADFPEANLRHYVFMLEGLRETQQALAKRGVRLIVRRQAPDQAALALADEACLLVTDRGYLCLQKQWRSSVARQAPCPVVQVETEVVTPVEVVSDKEEYAARTLRPRLHRQLTDYLHPLRQTRLQHTSLDWPGESLDLSDPLALAQALKIPATVGPVQHYRGGATEARRRLREFVARDLADYAVAHSDPAVDRTSHLSPYLHFGQISPLEVALAVAGRPGPGAESFLEELLVRRELSMNFVHFNPAYDRYEALPDWARRTLAAHAADTRPIIYTPEQLEQADTHDRYWNAAMRELLVTGYMHNYLRMYWGKKVLEWSPSPEAGFAVLLTLNNRYLLDGRDPASFTNVAWCFGKHDRPWRERPIFGQIRYMNAAGLERKFDMAAYLARVAALS